MAEPFLTCFPVTPPGAVKLLQRKAGMENNCRKVIAEMTRCFGG
jgi:hypothetical protein